ncbi:MAG: hypothetical protein HY352_01825, partial [Candidatus Omnitrophica bacterium]|nr:hypothetical protein [Candidatus Omnitrophota bacterium]
FEYDDLSRLTSAIGAYGSFNYVYDPLGNMLEKEGVTMAYGENGAGPHAVTSAASTQHPALSLAYDANGNMIEKNPCPQSQVSCLTSQVFAYDAENRLAEVKTAQEQTVSVTFKPGWNFFSLPVIPAGRMLLDKPPRLV